LGKAAGEDGWEEKENQMSKDEGGWNSSFSEKPVRSRPRRLADWINPTGAEKVHSLIDKVYKRKNLEMAWEKVKENRGSGGVDGQTLDSSGLRSTAGRAVGAAGKGTAREHLSTSAGFTTPYSEAGQTWRVSNAWRANHL